MKTCLTVLFVMCCLACIVNAQEYKRNNNWALGFEPVIKFNFNTNLSFTIVSNLNTVPYCFIKSSSSSISDTNGNLLFFSNGFCLYDTSGYSIENGVFVNCPYGNVLANYYGSSLFDQTSIIIPKKGNQYYVFSTGMSDSVANNYLNHVYTEFDVLNYSVVDMDSNNGKGKVVQKNVVLADKQHYWNTALQAVKHANGKDWWLVKADCVNNRYQEFLVKEDTILGPFYQYVPLNNTGDFCYFYGQLYFSNNGNKMASSMYGHLLGTNFYYRNGVDLYDFNRCDGSLTFRKYYAVPEDTISYPNYDIQVGICFSPNDSLLYMSNMYSIYQIDLQDTNTNNSIFIHGPDTSIAAFPWYLTLASAPDGKIYIGNDAGTRKYMSYIDKPNIKGLGCQFMPQGLWQPYTNLKSPPNMPNYGLGKDTTQVCWPLSNYAPVGQTEPWVVYPNPTFNELTLVCKGAEQVMVYDVLGRLHLSVPLNKDIVENKINTATLAQGVYIVKIQRADQSVFTTKIIKE